MTDLIERLRAKWRAAPVLGGGSLNGPCYIRDDGMRLRNPDGPEAADEIAALRARVAEMRELLDIAVEDYDSSMGRSNAPLHWTNQASAILSNIGGSKD